MRNAICAVLLLFTLGACSRQPGSTPQQTSTPPATVSSAPQAGQTVTGNVLETMDAAGYTYARLKTAGGDIWAAVPQSRMAVGDKVSITVQMPSANFHSPTLNRDFPMLYFASRADEPAAPAAAPADAPPAGSGMMSAHGQGQGQMTGPPAGQPITTKIAPAPGGITVADVWAQRAQLAGKTVTVRGQVVKFNGGILDRNWLHIQDGTGDPKTGTNDLPLTSQGVAKVGDVVTITGKLTLNKDIGSGYKYGLIVENATIAVK